jgi:adenylate kinase
MDRTEKLQYEQGIEQYFDQNKVYDLFEKLFKELVINKPENPIDYLIESLKKEDRKRIFITGYPGTNRKDVSLSVAESLGYTCFSVESILEMEIEKKLDNAHQIEKNYNTNTLVDDDIVIELVRNQLIKYEEENTSYIIEGFPRNRTQAIFLQSIGLLPDNVIILKTSREKAEEQVFNKLRSKIPQEESEQIENKKQDENGEDIIDNNTNSEQQKDPKGFYCELPVDQFKDLYDVENELAKLLKFKNKTNAARRPPRIILIAPPSCGKLSIANRLARQLQIIPVNIMDLLNKEISLKNENSKLILESIENGELVNDKFVLKLLEDRLFCSDCMINGWIVTGFPKSKGQINFMDNMNPSIKPSLVCLVHVDENVIVDKAKKIKYDPKTGKYYREESKKFNALSDDVKDRLIPREQDEEDKLKKRIDIWKSVYEEMCQKNCMKLNGEEKKKKLCQLIEDAVGYNS